MSEAVALAEGLLRASFGERLRTRVPLAPFTTFRIGGPAALYLESDAVDDLVAVSAAIRESQIPVLVLGRGSNLLVSDAGFPGLVLRLGRPYRWVAVEGERVSAGAAMPLPALAGVALQHALTGLEWAVSVPASFGGAIRMNAGAHGADLAGVLETLELFDLGSGELATVKAEDAGFRYRASALPGLGVVTGGVVRLRPGAPEQIRGRMDEIREWRREHQPLAEPNCGSVFKNPPGTFAARLIEDSGLKGASVGGARVSRKHANFIVTSPGTRAADVLALIRSVQLRVAERTGIRLETEVHLVGEFDRHPR